MRDNRAALVALAAGVLMLAACGEREVEIDIPDAARRFMDGGVTYRRVLF